MKSLLFLSIFSSCLFAGEIEITVRFEETQLRKEKRKEYDLLWLIDCGMVSKVGAPMLPQANKAVLIPAGATVTGIEIVSTTEEIVSGEYKIYPVQKPRPFSAREPFPFMPPDTLIYSQNKWWPEKLVECKHTGSLSGYRIASVQIWPIQYNPVTGKIKFYSEIIFKIIYEENFFPTPIKEKHKNIFKKEVKKIVINPEKIDIWTPNTEMTSKYSPYLPPDTIEYVVITSITFAEYFEPLIEWKTKKGIPAKIVITDSLYQWYSGIDEQDKIRNFIKDAKEVWGTLWILLGGDTDVIPERKTYIFTLGDPYPPAHDTIPSDLYYACLDGTWDADGDLIYGEISDSVDMYSDIFVGRASISTSEECTTFVNKTLYYEKYLQETSYIKKMLLLAEHLFYNPPYEGDFVNDSIAKYNPSDYYEAKLYQSLGNISDRIALDSIEAGYHFIHHAAHGGVKEISTGNSEIESSELDNLTNAPRYSIYTAISCLPGAFDYDCYAESWMNNPNGGGVASCFNSRYGWGSLDHPGRSEWLNIKFFRLLFDDSVYNIGQTLAFAKNYYVSSAIEDEVARFCLYTLTLFGDPELPMWSDHPESLDVTYSENIGLGMQSFVVNCSYNGTPVRNVRVCVTKDEEVYSVGITDVGGNVTLLIRPITPGILGITATCYNFYPYEGICHATASGPFVIYKTIILDDKEGNNDKVLNPGEQIEMKIVVHNVGSQTANEVKGILMTQDSFVTQLQDTLQNYGDISVGVIDTSDGSYKFTLSKNAPDGHIIRFSIQLSDNSSNQWVDSIYIKVYAPRFRYETCSIIDTISSNTSGYWDPGEEIELSIDIKNIGKGKSDSTYGQLYTENSHITVTQEFANFGEILSDSIASCIPLYKVKADTEILIGDFVEFVLYITGWTGKDTQCKDTTSFYVRIGPPGIMYADHDTGNVRFTVTCQGICGFIEQSGRGSGFKYPINGNNHLFIGSLWLGNSAQYVVNRDYRRDNKDWVVTEIPDGKLVFGWNQISDQDGLARYSDAGHSSAKNIIVMQKSWAWADESYNDFVIIRYEIKNEGTSSIEDLYVGQFMDFDISNIGKNKVKSDTIRNLVYQWCSTLTSSVCGVKLLDPKMQAKMSAINMKTYMYPNYYILDEDKIKFLNGELSFPNPQEESDYGVIVSVGPFTLGSEETKAVAFAILGGDSIGDIIENADKAQEKYDEIKTEKKEKPRVKVYRLCQNIPNPFTKHTVISYTIPTSQMVSLKIYDLSGRIVKTLIDKSMKAGYHKVSWDGKSNSGTKVRSGIYFYRLEAGSFKSTQKLIFLR